MNEKLATSARVEERFGQFVLEHIGLALRWEIMDFRPVVPIAFVMFSRGSSGTVSEDMMGLEPSDYYGMEVFMRRSDAERRHGNGEVPYVYVDCQPGDVEVLDPYVRMERIAPQYNPLAPSHDLQALDVMIDKLEALEARDMFVPAGLRTFRNSV